MSVEVLAGSSVPVVEVRGLPCSLRPPDSSSGSVPADAATYWRQSEPDPDRPEASFRGRSLEGSSVRLPAHYEGLVIDEFLRGASDDGERRFFVGGKFARFAYFNWDRAASRDDPIRRALEWIDVADALHDPPE